jgi:hypothetical protein
VCWRLLHHLAISINRLCLASLFLKQTALTLKNTGGSCGPPLLDTIQPVMYLLCDK